MERTWLCEECDEYTTWTYEDLASRGTPVCPECDEDMTLQPQGDKT